MSVTSKATQESAAGVRELRLGLVCYGGVSLAIYMHGMTKEIHRAVRASVLGERGIEPEEGAKSERAYAELLAALVDQDGARTRIVIDTIAGSSAGGINGIFLAKALAHDHSQDTLRDLWFEHGDLSKIIRSPDLPGPEIAERALEEALERLLRNGDAVPSRETKIELGLAGVGVARGADSLLDGNEMSQRIYEALNGMERAKPEGLQSLMPKHHTLELSVTVTDYRGYRRVVPLADPRVVAEGQHRHLLEFRYGGGKDDFDGSADGALTLAARATSSLPLGFQPINPETFPETLPAGATSLDKLKPYFRAYSLSEANPAWAYLIDGGVLDNKPFAPVIKAIKQRRANSEVDRYLVFLEPDPHAPRDEQERPREPHPLSAVLAALTGLPRSEPILDELRDVLVRNQQVRAVRDVIETNWSRIERIVRKRLPSLDDPPADPGVARLQTWNKRIHKEAVALNELGEIAYVRLRISSALDGFGRAACLVCDFTDTSNQAFLVHEVLRRWARDRELFAQRSRPTAVQRDFVNTFDLAFPERRLHFVIAGVNWLYRDVGRRGFPSRQRLDDVKERLYDAVDELQRLSSGVGFSEDVLKSISTCFGERLVTDYLRDHQFDVTSFLIDQGRSLDRLNERLKAFLDRERPKIEPALYHDLVLLTDGWRAKPRRDLLIRYLGFPIWDALLYPVQALSDVAERDEVRVMRLSPLDSRQLRPVLWKSKAEGAKLGHAFAFFSREARENDYLWGRLDAAERLVRLLLTRYETKTENDRTTEEPVSGDKHERYDEWCQRAMSAILEEDAQHLPSIEETVEDLRGKVEALWRPGATRPAL